MTAFYGTTFYIWDAFFSFNARGSPPAPNRAVILTPARPSPPPCLGGAAERTMAAEEALVVSLVLERLRAAEALVTFNGKTFDLPFLRARAEAHGLTMPKVEHVDLLALARKRRHRAARGGLRLQQLEVDLLGLKREGDIPGREAPRRYAEYLDREDATRIHPLLVHNVDDIVSMAPLLGHLTGDEPSTPEASAEVLWDRARLAAHAGRLPEAAAFYDAAVDAEIDPRRAREARRAFLFQVVLARFQPRPFAGRRLQRRLERLAFLEHLHHLLFIFIIH